jgi:hypothetical protein
MSFNEQFSTQRETPGSRFDPEPSVRGPFDSAFNIFGNNSESLTEITSSQISVSTQLQRTNKDSHVAIGEPPPAFNTPFDYTWVHTWAQDLITLHANRIRLGQLNRLPY